MALRIQLGRWLLLLRVAHQSEEVVGLQLVTLPAEGSIQQGGPAVACTVPLRPRGSVLAALRVLGGTFRVLSPLEGGSHSAYGDVRVGFTLRPAQKRAKGAAAESDGRCRLLLQVW